MKTFLHCSVLAFVVLAISASPAFAHYDHDKTGYFDEHHHHHDFVRHNGHRGYWDHNDSGARVFITI
jgi:hypothetical protein